MLRVQRQGGARVCELLNSRLLLWSSMPRRRLQQQPR
jgi:hypothetical protein